MRAFAFPALVTGLLAIVGLAACGVYDVPLELVCYDDEGNRAPKCCGKYPNHYACPADAGIDGDPDGGADASNDGDVDASTDDGGPPAAVCPWPCTPVGGAGFDPFPSYVWFGDEDESPSSTLDGLEWTSSVDVKFADPICPSCSCVAPTDSCALPSVWSVHSTVCQDFSSPIVTPFDSPQNWSGSCTSTSPIAAGVTCDGEPCVKSLVLQPPTIAPCVAEPPMPPEGQTLPPPTQRKAIEFVSASTGQTCGIASNCITPPPPGYQLCFVANDVENALPCPEGFDERHTGWRIVSDTRACSACSCGAPEGGSCDVRATVFEDAACGIEQGSLVLSSNDAAACVDLPVGGALGSKSAEILSYQPGECAPSTSEIIGEIITELPVTYCCVPLPPVPE